MVNGEWNGAQALENAFRVADEELRKVERERDEAVARAGQLRDERDDAERRYRGASRALVEWHGRWGEVERERDEWEGKYLDTDEALHRTRRERDEAMARAEAAEARTAVTREDVEKAIHFGHVCPYADDVPYVKVRSATDAACRLFGVEAETVDPVEELAGQTGAALRAVLGLHKPGTAYGVTVCKTCSQVKTEGEWDDPNDSPVASWLTYPCPTVRAITTALGEEA